MSQRLQHSYKCGNLAYNVAHCYKTLNDIRAFCYMQLNNVRIRPNLLALKLSKSNVVHAAAAAAGAYVFCQENTPKCLLAAKTKQLFLSCSLLTYVTTTVGSKQCVDS